VIKVIFADLDLRVYNTKILTYLAEIEELDSVHLQIEEKIVEQHILFYAE